MSVECLYIWVSFITLVKIVKSPVLEIDKLSKSYGSIRALEGLSLTINRGEVYGILGPNGSGKTTTLGILLDVIRPNSGTFSWFGAPPSKYNRRKIGSILEVPTFYPYLSGADNLKIIARIKGISKDHILPAITRVGLASRMHTKYRTYSLGMKQRLAIAAAMLGDPEVLILDEPTNGLDPKGIAEIRELIVDIGKKGLTIILASHILDEVQKICSHVAVLDKGKKLFAGEVQQVLNESALLEVASANMSGLKIALDECPFAELRQEEDGKYLVKLDQGQDPGALNSWLFEKGLTLSHLGMRQKSLEKYFLELLDKE
jgi:ABC-2 type transport system ATP-binding protein